LRMSLAVDDLGLIFHF